jgi:ubiquinone/menaquinone biosynthesis C-methylase UbiE
MKKGAGDMLNIFDTMADRYDAWYDSEEGRPLYESEFACLKPLVEDAPRPILEVGVGTGRFAMYFLPATGLDPALTTLKLAEKPGIETVQGIGEKLPFDDGSFGCVLIIVTICFVEDPFKVLIEAKRVLKKDGRIIIGLVPADSPWGAFYHKKKRQGYPFYERSRFYSFDETNKLLEDAGLKITRIRSTLIRRPEQPRQVEEPVEGYVKGAGFLCMEARKKS